MSVFERAREFIMSDEEPAMDHGLDALIVDGKLKKKYKKKMQGRTKAGKAYRNVLLSPQAISFVSDLRIAKNCTISTVVETALMYILENKIDLPIVALTNKWMDKYEEKFKEKVRKQRKAQAIIANLSK